MLKERFINSVVTELETIIDSKQKERLKMVLYVKLHNIRIEEEETQVNVYTCDNDMVLKRFFQDMKMRNLSDLSIKAYIMTTRNFLEEIGKNFYEVSAYDIMDYLTMYQYKRKVSNTTRKNMRMFLNSFFKWAYRKKLIKEDIMLDVENVKTDAKKKEYLSKLEIEMLRDCCKTKKEIAILDLLLSTGMRVSELVNLNIQDLDFENDEIVIYGKKSRKYRKGYLNAKAKKHILEYLETREDKQEALFLSGRQQRIQKWSIESLVQRIAKRADIRKHCTVHLFRKTFATQLYNNGCEITIISKLLGHTSTRMTLEYYLHLDSSSVKYKVQQCI